MKPDAGALAPRVSSGRLRNRRPSTCTAVLWTVSGIVASLSVQVCEVREIPVSLLVVESVAYEKVVRNTEALIPHRDIPDGGGAGPAACWTGPTAVWWIS